ncbi:hypothetical protein ACQ4PT_057856 [Festuca glaucescens]
MAVAVARRDQRAVPAVVEEEHVAGRGAGDHVRQRALDVGPRREHLGAASVGEHGHVGRREAEPGDQGAPRGLDVVDAAAELVAHAGVVAAHQRGQHLLLARRLPLHLRSCFSIFSYSSN